MGGAQGSGDPGENVLGGAAHGIVVPVCLSASGGNLSVSKQVSADRRAEANGYAESRVSVAQVVNTKVLNIKIGMTNDDTLRPLEIVTHRATFGDGDAGRECASSDPVGRCAQARRRQSEPAVHL